MKLKTKAEDVIVSRDRGDFGTLTDANGIKVHKLYRCTEANLTTGECVIRQSSHGKLIRNSRGESVLVTIDLPAPMHFKPYT